MIQLGREVCANFFEGGSRDWLETNGRGSFASATIFGSNTRRTHSLLTLAHGWEDRPFQTINRLEENLTLDQGAYPLSCQMFADGVHQEGFHFLDHFRLDPFPIWTYAVKEVTLEKMFFLCHGEDTAVVVYRHIKGPSCALEVSPFLTFRLHDRLVYHDQRFSMPLTWKDHVLTLQSTFGPAVYMSCADADFVRRPLWREGQEYEMDSQAGLDAWEDVYSPGSFAFQLDQGKTVAMMISTSSKNPQEAVQCLKRERKKRLDIAEEVPLPGNLGETLVLASEPFVLNENNESMIIRGYPSLDQRGIVSYISFPGLFLPGKYFSSASAFLNEVVKSPLEDDWFRTLSNGDVFPEVDTVLWFIWAVQNYVKASGDMAFVRENMSYFVSLIEAFEKGTHFGVGMGEDGLLVTPYREGARSGLDEILYITDMQRTGACVDIQALWYNALRFLENMDKALGHASETKWGDLAKKTFDSFNEKFWNEEADYPFSHITGQFYENALLPHALLSISLPYAVLDEVHFKKAVETAARRLYTPLGLRPRGLVSGHSRSFSNETFEKRAFPWLMGPFLTAYVKAFGASENTKSETTAYLAPFLEALSHDTLGTFPEFFEGYPPRKSGGTQAFAPSVAELLRVIWEQNLDV